ncbi:MAG TPA: hypothetical protein VGJ92_13450 [Methanocella sp.]
MSYIGSLGIIEPNNAFPRFSFDFLRITLRRSRFDDRPFDLHAEVPAGIFQRASTLSPGLRFVTAAELPSVATSLMVSAFCSFRPAPGGIKLALSN